MTRTHSDIGRANNRKGKDRERKVVRYLREHGWPDADRTGHEAYRTATRTRADRLDITGTPGLVWSVKDDASAQTRAWLAEVEHVCLRQNADLGMLVVRRFGKASPGQWWAWMTYSSLIVLETHRVPRHQQHVPVRLELGDLVPMLHHAGYGVQV